MGELCMFRSDVELKLECLKLAIQSCCSYDAVDVAKQYYRFLVENSENVPVQFLFNNKANLN
ncbi:hypothetical protein [Rickettsia endosymbiont of Lasioglossum villosulum]|uniref:hypothetical protein n=2 Tax=Rickettsia TaxID=780 RepID=UPI003132A63A